MANKYEGLGGFGPEIRNEVQTKALNAGKTYDPDKFEKAEPIVKNELSKQWIHRLATRFQDEDPEEFGNKIYRNLWINRLPADASDEEKEKFQELVVERTKEVQKELGFTWDDVDGIIGPKTLERLDRATGDNQFSGPLIRKDGTSFEPIWAPVEEEYTQVEMQSGEETEKLSKKEQKEIGNTTMDGLIKADTDIAEAEKNKGEKEAEFKKSSEANDKSMVEVREAQDKLELAKTKLIDANIEAQDIAVDKDNAQKALEAEEAKGPDGDPSQVTALKEKVDQLAVKQREAVKRGMEADEALDDAKSNLDWANAKRKTALENFWTAKKGVDDANAVLKNHQILKENLEKINLDAGKEARKAELAAQELNNPEPATTEAPEEETESTIPVAEPIPDGEATDNEEVADVPQEQESETTEAVDESAPAEDEAPAAPSTAPTTEPETDSEAIPVPPVPKPPRATPVEDPADDL
jgi:predicted metal-dependent hydrolase